MCAYKGVPVDGREFFKLLYSDAEFCKQLGKVVLAAGRLEAELRHYMALRSVPVSDKQATLGALIARVEKDDLLKKMKKPLSVLKTQRNYLFHNVFALLSGVIEETILEGSNLLDSDVATYQERAWVLTDNLNGMADIVERKKAHITNRSSRPAHKGAAG